MQIGLNPDVELMTGGGGGTGRRLSMGWAMGHGVCGGCVARCAALWFSIVETP